MRKACITIGVDRVVGAANLAILRAAADGAQRFTKWAGTQDFECSCLTDGTSPVSIADVKRKIRAIVESGSYGQLIIYFAGHGILKSWDCELWLLSDAAADPNEAVNLAGSISLSRNSGISHIVFISDACRSIAADPRLAQVTGSILFPIQPVTSQRPEVDTFYATLPGDPSYEVPSSEAATTYEGIFTECLLRGLAGGYEHVWEVILENEKQISVVSSRGLKPCLETEVPKLTSTWSLRLNQIPELRVESQTPKYLARFGAEEKLRGGAYGRPEPFISPSIALQDLADEHHFGNYFGPGLRAGLISGSQSIAVAFDSDMSRLLETRGREASETRTGFTVSGAGVTAALLDGEPGHCDVFEERGAMQVRVRAESGPLSTVLIFADGRGTCLAALPGYIGAVNVEDGRVVNVSYTPSRFTPRWNEYEAVQIEVEKRRAFVAIAARRGIFKIDRANAPYFAEYIRNLKIYDPTLGIYAAYAYSQADLVDDVLSVYEWMGQDPQVPIPFDVALLANQLKSEDLRSGHICPMSPMLTQGWALLHEGLQLPEWLLQASRYTLPALWTTLSPEGVQFVGQMLRTGAAER